MNFFVPRCALQEIVVVPESLPMCTYVIGVTASQNINANVLQCITIDYNCD